MSKKPMITTTDGYENGYDRLIVKPNGWVVAKHEDHDRNNHFPPETINYLAGEVEYE